MQHAEKHAEKQAENQGNRRGAAPTSAPTLTPGLAAVIALAGTVLYLDGMGVLAIGLYYWGFGPTAAPALALLLALACAAAAISNRARLQALALLFALTLFALLRLPTGNLWDALLDPLLWGWALVSLGLHAWRRRRHAQLRGRGRLIEE